MYSQSQILPVKGNSMLLLECFKFKKTKKSRMLVCNTRIKNPLKSKCFFWLHKMFTVCEFCKSPRAGLPTLKIDSSSYMVLLISSSINFTMGLDPISFRILIFNIMKFEKLNFMVKLKD